MYIYTIYVLIKHCDVKKQRSFIADFGIVRAEVKQTKGQPGPGEKDFAFGRLRAVPEG